MNLPFEVFVIHDRYVVLELSELLTAPAPALELHVLRDRNGTKTRAYWLLIDGQMLSAVTVGEA